VVKFAVLQIKEYRNIQIFFFLIFKVMYCVELKRNPIRAGLRVEKRHTFSLIFISRIKN